MRRDPNSLLKSEATVASSRDRFDSSLDSDNTTARGLAHHTREDDHHSREDDSRNRAHDSRSGGKDSRTRAHESRNGEKDSRSGRNDTLNRRNESLSREDETPRHTEMGGRDAEESLSILREPCWLKDLRRSIELFDQHAREGVKAEVVMLDCTPVAQSIPLSDLPGTCAELALVATQYWRESQQTRETSKAVCVDEEPAWTFYKMDRKTACSWLRINLKKKPGSSSSSRCVNPKSGLRWSSTLHFTQFTGIDVVTGEAISPECMHPNTDLHTLNFRKDLLIARPRSKNESEPKSAPSSFCSLWQGVHRDGLDSYESSDLSSRGEELRRQETESGSDFSIRKHPGDVRDALRHFTSHVLLLDHSATRRPRIRSCTDVPRKVTFAQDQETWALVDPETWNAPRILPPMRSHSCGCAANTEPSSRSFCLTATQRLKEISVYDIDAVRQLRAQEAAVCIRGHDT